MKDFRKPKESSPVPIQMPSNCTQNNVETIRLPPDDKTPTKELRKVKVHISSKLLHLINVGQANQSGW